MQSGGQKRQGELMIDLRRILVPIDFSPHSEQALKYGTALAEKFGARLYLVHVFQDLAVYQTEVVSGAPPILPPLEQLTASAKAELDRIVAEKNLARVNVHAEVVEGSPVEEIVDYAKEQDIDLIILGTHGRGWLAHVLLGSVAEKVVRKAPCPVLTVRLAEHEFVKETPEAGEKMPAG
jgi:nucleotide-binding universal stress UspA family protein